MTARLSPQREAEIDARSAHLYEYSTSHSAEWDELAGEDVPALLAELAAVRAERDEALTRVDEVERKYIFDTADLKRQRDELTRRDITSPLAVIVRHGDMSQTVRQEIRNLLADAEARS